MKRGSADAGELRISQVVDDCLGDDGRAVTEEDGQARSYRKSGAQGVVDSNTREMFAMAKTLHDALQFARRALFQAMFYVP